MRSPHLDVSLGDALGVSPFDCWVTFPSSICGGSSESAVLRADFFSCLLSFLFTATTSSYWLKNAPEQHGCRGFSSLLLPLLKPSGEANASHVGATSMILRCETEGVDKVCCSPLPFVVASNLALLFGVCRGEALTVGGLMKAWHSGMFSSLSMQLHEKKK